MFPSILFFPSLLPLNSLCFLFYFHFHFSFPFIYRSFCCIEDANAPRFLGTSILLKKLHLKINIEIRSGSMILAALGKVYKRARKHPSIYICHGTVSLFWRVTATFNFPRKFSVLKRHPAISKRELYKNSPFTKSALEREHS